MFDEGSHVGAGIILGLIRMRGARPPDDGNATNHGEQEHSGDAKEGICDHALILSRRFSDGEARVLPLAVVRAMIVGEEYWFSAFFHTPFSPRGSDDA